MTEKLYSYRGGGMERYATFEEAADRAKRYLATRISQNYLETETPIWQMVGAVKVPAPNYEVVKY